VNRAKAVVRALDIAIRRERLIRGEPPDRVAAAKEQRIRREYERWMTAVGDDEERGSEEVSPA
jgi:hypothetical protein